MGLYFTLAKNNYFLNFITLRQLPLVAFFRHLVVGKSTTSFSFVVKQKTQDDDTLLQALKISDPFNYQVNLQTNTVATQVLSSLLAATKIPCRV